MLEQIIIIIIILVELLFNYSWNYFVGINREACVDWCGGVDADDIERHKIHVFDV